ncbi:uncharacterized protein VDAG_00050 [Verticillium dahliae VdLs.17]|uniref:Major facilitator superfamily transporter n=2 Tax=Verticillium dahliae TaxID=27337 RepID=G2WR67_VERDV|nr:uncharacterized protein VDAG_00050 [Verticillium dahliae VdLs.17]EGY13368.1 hypothetical protein VDAG_00050 [Verticillium dahliae VdLs.17]KAH6709811.1 hypothetical protein EV126DRAFT_3731 [Verticillium dahliae]
MERVSSFLSNRSSRSNSATSNTILHEKSELPPPSQHKKTKLRMRALLGHCLYRRVTLWSVLILVIMSMVLLKTAVHTKNGRVVGGDGFLSGNSPEEQNTNHPVWIGYKHLNGYFNGLKSLVPMSNHTAEWPNPEYTEPITEVTLTHETAPLPKPYRPQPDYESAAYLAAHPHVNECFLDEKKTPVPDTWAFQGLPQSMPDPALGDYNILGIRNDICFDRFGRYGPYGLGYSAQEGGTGEGLDTERSGSEVVWSKTGKIDYTNVDWGDAQERCVARNQHRFVNETDEVRDPTLGPAKGIQKLERTAVLVRTYVGFRWTQHVILNFRAMIAELALKSGGEYTLHFLLHVKNLDAPIWSDPSVVQDILDANVPAEFHTICTLWSEAQMRLYYPGTFSEPFENPSNRDIHGVYRSAHMPMQIFALQHPEYAHFWNWELDMRYTGSYYELFDRAGSWAKKQSRQLLWERSAKYYIPALHGSWEDFSRRVEQESIASGRKPVMGPVEFAGRQTIFGETGVGRRASMMPANCDDTKHAPEECGVGEEADIITLNPLFDTEDSGWVFSKDVTGYNTRLQIPPRRCAIVTASRLSRRLILAMHEETWRHHHSMFSEMFPPTVALHHGFKAAYAPHPVYLDRGWQYEQIEAAFNGGRDGTSGGPGSPFDIENEHNHKGTSWYFNSEFAGLTWRRWLGYPQMDGRTNRAGEGTMRGGLQEESSAMSSGRMCLRSMLVHPIKFENPDERS